MGKNNDTKFSSENQPTRRRGKSKRTRMLEVLKTKGWKEEKLWLEVLELGLAGDSAALSGFLNRLAPANKSTLPKLRMRDLDERFFDLSEVGQIKFLTWLVFRGEVAPDTASVVVGMITAAATLIQGQLGIERLDALEEVQEAMKNIASGNDNNDILHKVIRDGMKDAELLQEIARGSMTDLNPGTDPDNTQMIIDDLLNDNNSSNEVSE